MNRLFLPLTVLLLSLNAAAAFNKEGYDKLVDKYCYTRQEWVSEAGARKAANAEAEKKLRTSDYFEIWEKTCKEKMAYEGAVAARQGKLDLRAFLLLARKSCAIGTPLPSQSAIAAAKAVARKQIDAGVFAQIWTDSCDTNLALEGAKAAKAGQLDANAIHDYYEFIFDRCLARTRAKPSEAKQLASAMKSGTVDRTIFFQRMGASCDFQSALTSATRKASRAPSFLEPPVVEESNGTSGGAE